MMEPTSFWAKLMEYGLAGVVIGILFYIIWKMLIWVMAWVDKINTQHNSEREVWAENQREERKGYLEVMNTMKQAIELHNQSSIESRKSTEEAHRFQREEHKEMIVILGRINGYKDDHK